MTITDLQKRIAEVLGVSSSEKELAFNIFISKVADNLEYDLTLKVPRIGFFQLKESDVNVKESLIYTPFSDELSKDSRILYLTIEIPHKVNRSVETDSDIFSIGVGKPLLPLTNDLSTQSEVETSYIILKRSIEERVNEIIAESDVLPNFNIWDDYYESLQTENKRSESQSKLSELTSDLEFKEDLIAEDIANNLINDENLETNTSNEEQPQSISVADLLEDYNSPNEVEVTDEVQPTSKIEEIIVDLTSDDKSNIKDDDKEIIVDLSKQEPEIEVESFTASEELKDLIDDYEKEKISELEYNSIKDLYGSDKESESDIEKFDYISDIDSDIETKEDYLGLKKSFEEKIEWNWGDELKEELGPSLDEEDSSIFDFDEEDEKEIDNDYELDDSDKIFKTTKPIKSHLFDQLENTVKKELLETKNSKDYIEYSPTPKYEFVEDRYYTSSQQYNSVTPAPSRTDEQYYNELKDERDKYFNKNFLLIFSGFVIIVSIIIYMLLPNKGESNNASLQEESKIDTNNTEQLQASLPQDTNKIIPEEETDFPRVASLPVADKNINPNITSKEKVLSESVKTRTNGASSLYNTPTSDIRVGKTIYYDGKNYNVQISSWKNKEKAEQEVARLRSLGLNAFIFEAYLPQKGGTWYRVRVGNFKTKEEAEIFYSKNSL